MGLEDIEDPYSNEIYSRNIGRAFGRCITVMDPPEHRDFRVLLQKAFSPVASSKWGREVVSPVVNRLIDSFAGRGHAELSAE